MPIASICSLQRHPQCRKALAMADNKPPIGRNPRSKSIALFTSETSIEVRDPTLTIQQAMLEDRKINDILDIYVVETTGQGDSFEKKGKEAIFGMAKRWVRLPRRRLFIDYLTLFAPGTSCGPVIERQSRLSRLPSCFHASHQRTGDERDRTRCNP